MTYNLSDLETEILVRNIVFDYGVEPLTSIESEKYFRDLIAQYDGEKDDDLFKNWLSEKIEQQFLCFDTRPEWIQHPEWPFYEGKPMIFVNHVDVLVESCEKIGLTRINDRRLYIFMARDKDVSEVIWQCY